MRGSDDMMNKLHDTVNDMLAPKIKSDMVGTNRQIVFSFFHNGKVTSLNAQEFRFYSQTLIDLETLPSTDGSRSGAVYPIIPYYNKDDAAFMPHKYIPRAFWHHACGSFSKLSSSSTANLLVFSFRATTPSRASKKAHSTAPSTRQPG